MNVCMCVCMYVCMCLCMCIYISCVHVFIFVYVFVHLYMCVYLYCVHVRMFLCMYILCILLFYVHVNMYDEALLSPHLDQEPNNYSDQTRVTFNIVPTKLNTLLSPLLYICKTLKIIHKSVRSNSSPRHHWLPLLTKMANCILFFSPRNRWFSDGNRSGK